MPRQTKLPAVLSVQEVDQLLGAIRKPAIQCFFWTVYSLGLRLQEALHLQIEDIESQRMMVHIRRGKGHKDRLIPLPPETLRRLRAHWATHRNPQWLFPREGRDHQQAATATQPIDAATIQGCIRQHVMPRSCGDRHCPCCQGQKARQWLDDQLAGLLPCVYFLVTFTVPSELRKFIRRHRRRCYDALFKAAAATPRELAKNPRHVGSDRLGFTGVLHTWGQSLT